MIGLDTVIAVIPARGGSKRLPRKNTLSFRGKPLLDWAIKSASDSRYIDKFVVSTEDAEIKSMVNGCMVIDRPEWLAKDDTLNEDVLRHVLKMWWWYTWCVLLQPTSPLRTARDIDQCILLARDAGNCISVRENGSKNGAVYIARTKWLLDGHDFSEPANSLYYMPNERSVDIDYEKDLRWQECNGARITN